MELVRKLRMRRGYILVAASLSLTFLLGISGLAIDIGRMYIAKGECQAYADSAALAAAKQLDGTAAGIARANSAASGDINKWRLDTSSFGSVTPTYATSASGPFTATPPNPPDNYYYAQVVVAVNVPMYLIRVLTGPVSTVAARAIAGASTTPMTTMGAGAGIFPFSPYTRTWTGLSFAGQAAQPDDTSDQFGYKVGNQYTLRWGAPGNRTTCGTDATSNNLSDNGKIRGYCCAASGSAASIRAAIVSGGTVSVTIGQNVPMDNGAKDTEMTTIADRVNFDNDTTSTTYTDYVTSRTGNGARVVVVVVNGGEPNYIATGFAAFFLSTPDSYSGLKGNDSACAEYIGSWHEGQPFRQDGTSSASNHLRLVQ
jgi:hypothetical protein